MARLRRQITSTPRAMAVMKRLPSMGPSASATARAAGNTETMQCRAEASRVSSKSRACIMVLLARAARGGETLRPANSRLDRGSPPQRPASPATAGQPGAKRPGRATPRVSMTRSLAYSRASGGTWSQPVSPQKSIKASARPAPLLSLTSLLPDAESKVCETRPNSAWRRRPPAPGWPRPARRCPRWGRP